MSIVMTLLLVIGSTKPIAKSFKIKQMRAILAHASVYGTFYKYIVQPETLQPHPRQERRTDCNTLAGL